MAQTLVKVSPNSVRSALFWGQRLSMRVGEVKEDNHMPILPIMTCPEHVLELILLLI